MSRLNFRKRAYQQHQHGFTVIELMMATAVFSVVLLIGLTAFVQIGRAYYKGATIAQTRSTATNILNEIASNIRLDGGVSALGTSTSGRYYYCVGSHRYTFKPFNLVDTSNHDNTTNFGLLEDTVLGSSGCGNPFDAPSLPLSNPTEMLGNQMRILNFTISPVGTSTSLYSLNLTLAYGQDSALTSTNSPTAQCKLQLGGTQFCAITTLSTIVSEGI